MSNVGLILTIVLEIKDDSQAGALWKALSSDDPSDYLAGCRLFAVSNDNQLDVRDKYETVVDRAIENADNHSPEDEYPEKIETKCGKIFYWHPFNVYSSSFNNWCGTEWFSEIYDLKKKYEVL